MNCRLCNKELRYGGAGMYFPAREMKLCKNCYDIEMDKLGDE